MILKGMIKILLRIKGEMPEKCSFFCLKNGRKVYIDQDMRTDIEISNGESVTLMQNGKMNRAQKVLTVLWHFLTALIQLPFLFYSDFSKWEEVIPYRCSVKIYPHKSTECILQCHKGLKRFSKPKLSVLGDGIENTEISIYPSPWVFDDACNSFLCRICGIVLWALFLMGALLVVGIQNNNGAAIISTVATTFIILVVSAFIVVCNKKKCATLKREFEEHLMKQKTGDGSLS